MIQFIGQLNGRGANEQRHALVGFKIDVFKGLDLDKMLYPGQKSPFPGFIEAGRTPSCHDMPDREIHTLKIRQNAGF